MLYVHDMLMFYFQSNVLELWSLFDFLMPGFLGSEKQFQSRFGLVLGLGLGLGLGLRLGLG